MIAREIRADLGFAYAQVRVHGPVMVAVLRRLRHAVERVTDDNLSVHVPGGRQERGGEDARASAPSPGLDECAGDTLRPDVIEQRPLHGEPVAAEQSEAALAPF